MTDYRRTRVQIWTGLNQRLIDAVTLTAANLPAISDRIWEEFFKRYGDTADPEDSETIEERVP